LYFVPKFRSLECLEGVNRGSVFSVRLPLMAQAPQEELEVDGQAKPGAAQARKKLLVVDDNKMQATSLCLLLEFSGHEVKTAADGPSALSAVGRLRTLTTRLSISVCRAA
jgi:PleD family two-component response regulator